MWTFEFLWKTINASCDLINNFKLYKNWKNCITLKSYEDMTFLILSNESLQCIQHSFNGPVSVTKT